MSWEKGSTYYAQDSVVFDDGRPAAAHTLRTLDRGVNYLGASRRNLLHLGGDVYGGEISPEFAIPLSNIGRPEITKVPLWKPRGIQKATAYAAVLVPEDITWTFYVETSRGLYSATIEGDGLGQLIDLPVELNTSRADALRLSYSTASAYRAPHASAGTPVSGVASDLMVDAVTGKSVTYVGAATDAWSTSGTTFTGPEKHWLCFFDGTECISEHEIGVVLATDALTVLDRIDIEDPNPGSGEAPPAVGLPWAIVRRWEVVLQAFDIITDEVPEP